MVVNNKSPMTEPNMEWKCKRCGGTETMGHTSEICDVNDEKTEWEDEFREYFDKALKPRKPTMGNLDRELTIDFIRKVETRAYERGAAEERRRISEALKFDLFPVQIREENPRYWDGYSDTIRKVLSIIHDTK